MAQSQNQNLHKAKREKNDEFYTQLIDIENELKHYKDHFRGKTVLCNCDLPHSNFVKYFQDNFQELGLKKLLLEQQLCRVYMQRVFSLFATDLHNWKIT